MFLWPALKNLLERRPGFLESRQSVYKVANELLSSEYGAVPRRIDQAAHGDLAALDPRTLGQSIREGLQARREAAASERTIHKQNRGRHREDVEDRTYFKVGTAVENEIPAGRKHDRHSIVAARRIVSNRTQLSYDTVAQYHGAYHRRISLTKTPL
jgi:hypothetical protein